MSLAPSALRVLDLIEERLDALATRIAERMRSTTDDDAGYDLVPPADLRDAVAANVRRALADLRGEEPFSDEERAALAAVGELRARQGLSIEAVLRGVRTAGREALDTAQQLRLEAGLDVEASIDLAGALWDWVDDMSVELVNGHRRGELAMVGQDQQERAAFVHGLVVGPLSPHQLAAGAGAYGLDLDTPHHAVRVRPTDDAPPERLQRLLQPSRWSPGIVAVVDGDVAAVLPQLPTVELAAAAGVGPRLPLAAMGQSFFLASRALDTAVAFGRHGYQRLEDLSLLPAVLGEDHLGAIFAARYLLPLGGLGAFGGDLVASLRSYLRHDQNIDAAARELHVHPNTVRHRLRRFEEVTGASLHNVEQLAEVWWALTRAELGLPGPPASAGARRAGAR